MPLQCTCLCGWMPTYTPLAVVGVCEMERAGCTYVECTTYCVYMHCVYMHCVQGIASVRINHIVVCNDFMHMQSTWSTHESTGLTTISACRAALPIAAPQHTTQQLTSTTSAGEDAIGQTLDSQTLDSQTLDMAMQELAAAQPAVQAWLQVCLMGCLLFCCCMR